MRKLIVLAALVGSLPGLAQVKEGFVRYKTAISGAGGNEMLSALAGNSGMSIYFKNERSLTELVTPLYTMRTLTDSKETITFMDGTGEKIYTRNPNSGMKRIPQPKAPEPVVTVTTEKKKILGFDCTKMIVTDKDHKGNTATLTIWYTDKINCSASTGFINEAIAAKIKGMPLEIDIDKGAIKSKVTATELSLKPVPDATFAVSTAGYTERKAIPKKDPR